MTTEDLLMRIRLLEEENIRCKEIIREQMLEIQRLKGSGNPRGAGRKPADEKWIASFSEFIRMEEENCTREEIMQKLGVSRATFYRYQKLFNETNSR